MKKLKKLLEELLVWLKKLLSINKCKGVEREVTENIKNNEDIKNNEKKDKEKNSSSVKQTDTDQENIADTKDNNENLSNEEDTQEKDGVDDLNQDDASEEELADESKDISVESDLSTMEDSKKDIAVVKETKTDDNLRNMDKVGLDEILSNIEGLSSGIDDLMDKITNTSDLEDITLKHMEISEDIKKVNKKIEEEIKGLKSNDKKILGNIDNNYNEIKDSFTNKLMSRLGTVDKNSNKLSGRIGDLNGEISNVEEQIRRAERNIKKQLKNKIKGSNDKITEQIRVISALRNKIKALGSKLSELSFSNDIKEGLRPIDNKLEIIEDVIVEQFQPQTNKDLKEIKTTVELLEGKMNTLDDIKDTLTDEGISIEQKIAPSNEEEEVIMELADYGKEIFDHLTTAARHYAKKRQAIDKLDTIKKEHQEKVEKIKEESYQDGKQDGQTQMIKKLVNKFTDLDQLFNNNEGTEVVLASFLKNNGLVKDEELRQGEIIEIAEEERTNFEVKSNFESAGKFKVEKSCFKLAGDIISKAKLKKVKKDSEASDKNINSQAKKKERQEDTKKQKHEKNQITESSSSDDSEMVEASSEENNLEENN